MKNKKWKKKEEGRDKSEKWKGEKNMKNENKR